MRRVQSPGEENLRGKKRAQPSNNYLSNSTNYRSSFFLAIGLFMRETALIDRKLCQQRFREALSKANSARSAEVRIAYFDLASFYQRQLSSQSAFFGPRDETGDEPVARLASC